MSCRHQALPFKRSAFQLRLVGGRQSSSRAVGQSSSRSCERKNGPMKKGNIEKKHYPFPSSRAGLKMDQLEIENRKQEAQSREIFGMRPDEAHALVSKRHSQRVPYMIGTL